MDKTSIERAADILVAARKTGVLIDHLPEELRPSTRDEAVAVQECIMARLGESAGGWKIAPNPEFEWLYGIMFKSRIYADGARIPARLMPMLGLEAEIAFRFERALPPRGTDYTQEDVASAIAAMVGVEIVDTAYRENMAASALERAADLFSNGGFVCGTLHRDWRKLASAELDVALTINGNIKVKKQGPPIGKMPLERAVVMANLMRLSHGVHAGQVVTCGSYTGLEFAKPGDVIRADFAGIGAVEFTFTS